MSKSIKITCHGCKRKVNAIIIKEHWGRYNDRMERTKYGIVQIKKHKRGWFSSTCRATGRRFRTEIGFEEDPQGT